MWQFEHTQTSAASPKQLWTHYADPASWPNWDHDIAEVTIDGPIATGARGALKPTKGPRVSFVFSEVIPGVRFTNVCRLPLARLTFSHRIEASNTGTRFTHSAAITGPLSALFARIMGRDIATGMPTAMRVLARLAEQTSQSNKAP